MIFLCSFESSTSPNGLVKCGAVAVADRKSNGNPMEPPTMRPTDLGLRGYYQTDQLIGAYNLLVHRWATNSQISFSAISLISKRKPRPTAPYLTLPPFPTVDHKSCTFGTVLCPVVLSVSGRTAVDAIVCTLRCARCVDPKNPY